MDRQRQIMSQSIRGFPKRRTTLISPDWKHSGSWKFSSEECNDISTDSMFLPICLNGRREMMDGDW